MGGAPPLEAGSSRRWRDDGTFADVVLVRGRSRDLAFRDVVAGSRESRLAEALASWRYRRTPTGHGGPRLLALHRLERDRPARDLIPGPVTVRHDGEHLLSANSLIVSFVRDLCARGWLRVRDGEPTLDAPAGEEADLGHRLLAWLRAERRLSAAGSPPADGDDDTDGTVHTVLAVHPGGRLADLPTSRGLVFNTAFFLFEPDDLASHHSGLGQPYGLWVQSGTIRRPPLYPRGTLFHEPSAGWGTGRLGLGDVSVTLPGGLRLVPRPHRDAGGEVPCTVDMDDDVSLYTRAGHAQCVMDRTPPAPGRFECTVVDRRVTGWKKDGGLAVPQNGFVVSVAEGALGGHVARMLAAAAREPVTYRFLDARLEAVDHAIQGGPVLLGPGPSPLHETALRDEECFRPSWTDAQGRHAGIVPTDYATDVDRTRRPRTAVGVTRAGDLVVALVTGVEPEVTVPGVDSTGSTLQETADLLEEAGAVQAVNFDGGGSTQAYLDGGRLIEPGDRRGVRERPLERCVPSVGVYR